MNAPHQIPASARDQREQPALAVRIDAAKPYVKNTLLSFVDFTLCEIGLSFKGATVHAKDGRRWIGMPARSYSDAEGTHWVDIVEFSSREARDRITNAVLAAFDRFSTAGAR